MILKVEHDLDNVPTYLEKEVKTIPSYTAPKGPPEKRRGEWTKEKKNAFWSKITSVSRWKSSTKGGRSTLASGWRRQRIIIFLSNGVARVFIIKACIAWTYALTWGRAHARCNCANGGKDESLKFWKLYITTYSMHVISVFFIIFSS